MQHNFPNIIKNRLGFFEVENKPNPDELQAYYAQKYYQESKGSYENTYTEQELQHIRGKIALRYEAIKDKLPEKGTLLDVGCGEGFVLAAFAEKDWNVKGLDFSSAGIEAQNPDYKNHLVSGDLFALLEAEKQSGKTYDILWLQNVLEHVIDPVNLMKSLRQLINPKGILVVTVPNDFSELQLQALESGKIDRPFWIALPDHLSYFSKDSLKSIGDATSWNCETILADFPVDWFLYNKEANYIAAPSKGKSAHHARIELENMLLQKPAKELVPFYESLARLGMGRDLTAFFSINL